MISQSSIDKILSDADILSVAQSLVPGLKKQGTSWRAKSPFADEKTPSFYIVPAKEIYKCFSTGKGGHVVSLVRELLHVDFPEAMKWLAEHTNNELHYERDERTETQKSNTKKYIALNKACLRRWQQELHRDKGPNTPWAYLIERGFTEDEIFKLGLGFAPINGKFITSSILNSGSYEAAKHLGLVKTPKNTGVTHDCFRNRIIIPIYNGQDEPIGFGARTWQKVLDEHGKEKYPKYLNSESSDLYNKSATLYGLDLVGKKAIAQAGEVILCEGYMDVLALRREGVNNTVACCGTALTHLHIKQLRKHTRQICIITDGDKAGIAAMEKSIITAIEGGLLPRVCPLPDGIDPDDLVRDIEQYVEPKVDIDGGEVLYEMKRSA